MITDIEHFCDCFYAATFFPISYFKHPDTPVCLYPNFFNTNNIFKESLKKIIVFHKSPDYYLLNSFAYFGYININNSPNHNDYLVIGPVFTAPCTDENIRDYIRATSPASGDNMDVISNLLLNLPRITYNQFINLLGYLHYIINDEKIDVISHFHAGINREIQDDISEKYTQKTYNSYSQIEGHNTYDYERQMLELIRSGEPERLTKLILDQKNLIGELKSGSMGDNPLRTSQNQFIVITGLSLRAAIEGGLNIEEAYNLGDMYIQECERLFSQEQVYSLAFSMLVDFATRVSRQQLPISGMSDDVFKCIQYIVQRPDQQIRVDDVAAYIGKSRTYVSSHFKEELGFNLSDYIMHTKLEEAKSLLVHTDKPLCDISNYLCFSSQSYFQNVFKKKYGVTPLNYRKNHLKSS